MNQHRRGRVACSDEEKGRVHAKDGGIGHLKERSQKGQLQLLTLSDLLDQMMKVGHAKVGG